MTLSGWKEASIGEYIDFVGGAQPPRSTFLFEPQPEYTRLIQIRDYKSDRFKTFVPTRLAKKFCTERDVMVGRYGPPLFQILRGLAGAYNVALIKAVPKAGLDREYMYYFLQQDSLRRTIEHLSQRTGGQTGIEMDVLLDYPLPLPPLPEQRKLAQIFDCWDKAIELQSKMIEEKKSLLKGLTHQLTNGTLRTSKVKGASPQVSGSFGKYPRDWKMMKLKEFLQATERPVPKPTEPYRRLGLRNRGQGTFETIAEPEKVAMDTLYEIAPNELIVNITFAWEGAITLTSKDDAGALVSHRFPTFRFDEQIMLPNYFRYVTLGKRFVYHLGLVSPGGAGRNRVMSKKDFLDIEIPVPSIDEQLKIVLTLRTLEDELMLLGDLSQKLKEQKRGLMQQLLTGKKRVKV